MSFGAPSLFLSFGVQKSRAEKAVMLTNRSKKNKKQELLKIPVFLFNQSNSLIALTTKSAQRLMPSSERWILSHSFMYL